MGLRYDAVRILFVIPPQYCGGIQFAFVDSRLRGNDTVRKNADSQRGKGYNKQTRRSGF